MSDNGCEYGRESRAQHHGIIAKLETMESNLTTVIVEQGQARDARHHRRGLWQGVARTLVVVLGVIGIASAAYHTSQWLGELPSPAHASPAPAHYAPDATTHPDVP